VDYLRMDSSNKPSDKCFFSSVKTDETQRDRVKVKKNICRGRNPEKDIKVLVGNRKMHRRHGRN